MMAQKHPYLLLLLKSNSSPPLAPYPTTQYHFLVLFCGWNRVRYVSRYWKAMSKATYQRMCVTTDPRLCLQNIHRFMKTSYAISQWVCSVVDIQSLTWVFQGHGVKLSASPVLSKSRSARTPSTAHILRISHISAEKSIPLPFAISHSQDISFLAAFASCLEATLSWNSFSKANTSSETDFFIKSWSSPRWQYPLVLCVLAHLPLYPAPPQHPHTTSSLRIICATPQSSLSIVDNIS